MAKCVHLWCRGMSSRWRHVLLLSALKLMRVISGADDADESTWIDPQAPTEGVTVWSHLRKRPHRAKEKLFDGHRRRSHITVTVRGFLFNNMFWKCHLMLRVWHSPSKPAERCFSRIKDVSSFGREQQQVVITVLKHLNDVSHIMRKLLEDTLHKYWSRGLWENRQCQIWHSRGSMWCLRTQSWL